MPLLIDGHNVIGQMASLSLDDPDDEAKLLEYLRSYRARTGRRLTVVFDHGLPGGESRLSTGGVKVIFADTSTDADSVIMGRVRRAPTGSELVVISSDREVLDAARARKLEAVRAVDFAYELENPPSAQDGEDEEKPDRALSESEVKEWMQIFGYRPKRRRPRRRKHRQGKEKSK